MRVIESYKLSDGSVFEYYKDATRHLDKLETPIADSLINQLLKCDGKLLEFTKLIQNKEFLKNAVKMLELVEDREVFTINDNEGR